MTVEFNDEHNASFIASKMQSGPEEPRLVKWLISSGLASSADQANKILVGVTIVCLILAVVIYKMYV